MKEDIDVFVVCAAHEIERGQARAFSLSRITEAGEARPFPIFILHTVNDQYLGYVNSCPHQQTWLNIGDGKFFTDDLKHLRCGRHKAEFDIESGLCLKGPCKDKPLEPIAIVVIRGELCLCGVQLVEEEGMDVDNFDETMEITIQP